MFEIMNYTEVLVPIAVTCIMPIVIAALIAGVISKKSEHKMNVMIKAIENGAEIDQSILKELVSSIRPAFIPFMGILSRFSSS